MQEVYTVNKNTPIKEVLTQFCLCHPELELDFNSLQYGIYSERKQLDDTFSPNDRLEIYRELQQDPKMRRRNKVKK